MKCLGKGSPGSTCDLPNKISADAPLTPILYLGRRNAYRLPAAGRGWKNLIAGTTKHFSISSIGKGHDVSNFAFFLVTSFTNTASNYYCGDTSFITFDKNSILNSCKNICTAIIIIYSQNIIVNRYVCFVISCTFVFFMRFSNVVVKCFNQRTFHSFWLSPRPARRNQHQYQSNISHTKTILTAGPIAIIFLWVRSNGQQFDHAEFALDLTCETKGSSSRRQRTGNLNHHRNLASETFPGGWCLNCTHHRYAYNLIYAIINSMIPNKVDRSIA